MKILRRSIAVAAIVITAAATLGAIRPGAAIAADPPWESDPFALGSITFYNSSGVVVTGGNDLAHIADYAAASSGPSSGFASFYFAVPDHTKVFPTPPNNPDPSQWNQDLQGSSAYPNGSAPAPIDGLTDPVVSFAPGDACAICTITGFTQDATAGWANLLEARVYDTDTTHYWRTDISYDKGAGTWTQVFPILEPPNWLPVQSGPHRIGSADSCLASFDSVDSITYAWYKDGVVISGATGSKYTPPESFFGKDLSCSVSASNGGGTTEGTSKPVTLGVGAALVPTTKPYLYNGTDKKTIEHGKSESVNNGKWSPAATSFKYQWYLGSKKIGGATSNKYKPSASMVGKTISCLVTAKRLHWADGSYKTAGVKVT
jgi:hypothetical protein